MPNIINKLSIMLRFASEHNEFYKRRIKEYGISDPLDITQWPVLTRKELQENRYNMFSDGYKSKYYNQQLRRQSSSGSTGIPVNVYWDYKDWYASNMSLWRKRWEWYGIKPQDRYCVFTLNAFGITPEEGRLYYINEPKNVLSFNVSLIRDEHGYEQMAERINEFRPDWIYIQPFVMNQLIMAYKKLGIKPANSIRYIESVGELLTTDLRRRAEELFGVKATNMYGSEEMNGIAIESTDGDMHVLTDNVLLEIKNENGIMSDGEGESIITCLNNFAMPLIRYDQGDTVSLTGLGSGPVTSVNGRNNTASFNYNGHEISTVMLSETISEVGNQFPACISQFRFLYKKKEKKLYCLFKVNKEYSLWNTSIKNAFLAVFCRRTGIAETSLIKIAEDNEFVCTVKPRLLEIDE